MKKQGRVGGRERLGKREEEKNDSDLRENFFFKWVRKWGSRGKRERNE